MPGTFARRLDALERTMPERTADATKAAELPFLDTLTEDEKVDLCAYVFCLADGRPWPAHRVRREDAYYENLIARATGENR